MKAGDNPFRTECVLRIRYRLQGFTWTELLSRCAARGYRGALTGPHGSGKTTLLEDLAPRLKERGFGVAAVRLDAQCRSFERGFTRRLFAGLGPEDILLFDGAEQLSAVAWRRFRWQARNLGGLIITTHQPGRLPTLWECRTSASLLSEMLAGLLGTEPAVVAEPAMALFHKHGGNLREALRECYDRAAD